MNSIPTKIIKYDNPSQQVTVRPTVIVPNPFFQSELSQHVPVHVPLIQIRSNSIPRSQIESNRKPLRTGPEKRHVKGPAPKLNGDEKCTICSARATGFHYNVLSCEGCKNFFRRAIVHGLVYHCKTSKFDCCVTWNHRPRCQWCRLERCKRSGMKPQYINRTRPGKKNELPKNIRLYIKDLEKSWTESTSGIEKTNNNPYMNMDVEASADPNDPLPGIEKNRIDFFLEMAYLKTKRIIKFMNRIPGMEKISTNARIWLFKNSLAETMVIFNTKTFNPKCRTRNSVVPAVRWLDGVWRGADDFSKCGMTQDVIEQMFDVWSRIDLLKLDSKICSIMMSLIIVNQDRENRSDSLIEKDLPIMESIEEQLLSALRLYLHSKYGPKSTSIFGKIISIMTNLRNISNSTLQRQLAQLAKMEARMPQLLAVLFSFENAPTSSSDINFKNLTT